MNPEPDRTGEAEETQEAAADSAEKACGAAADEGAVADRDPHSQLQAKADENWDRFVRATAELAEELPEGMRLGRGGEAVRRATHRLPQRPHEEREQEPSQRKRSARSVGVSVNWFRWKPYWPKSLV